MDLVALKNEVISDPTRKGYAQHLPIAPGLVVDLLNSETESMVKTRYVTARTILAECDDGAAILDELQSAAQSVSAVKWMLTFLQQDSGMDAGHPRTQANIDDLVRLGLLSSNYGAALKALAMQSASRAEVLGLSPVTIPDLISAGVA